MGQKQRNPCGHWILYFNPTYDIFIFNEIHLLSYLVAKPASTDILATRNLKGEQFGLFAASLEAFTK